MELRFVLAKLVCLPGRYRTSCFPEHGTIQAVGGDTVTSFFNDNLLHKSQFLHTMGFYHPYFCCSLGILLPLFNFCEVSHAERTITFIRKKTKLRVWWVIDLFPFRIKTAELIPTHSSYTSHSNLNKIGGNPRASLIKVLLRALRQLLLTMTCDF